jgi:hypothetical protein
MEAIESMKCGLECRHLGIERHIFTKGATIFLGIKLNKFSIHFMQSAAVTALEGLNFADQSQPSLSNPP